MLIKDHDKRPKIAEIKQHPWFHQNGELDQKNANRLKAPVAAPVEVTEEEIAHSVSSVTGKLLAAKKVARQLHRRITKQGKDMAAQLQGAGIVASAIAGVEATFAPPPNSESDASGTCI